MSINTLLVGESKTGKSQSLDTLPGVVVGFSFDIGGWHPLARKRDKGRKLGEEELEAWVTDLDHPVTVITNFKKWLANNTRDFLSHERVVIDYAKTAPIALGQYTQFDATLMTTFIHDFNQLWHAQPNLIERGLCHVYLDSLTSFQRPVMEYIKAMNSRLISVVQDWGQAIDKIDEVIQNGVALPFDFIMTAHTVTEKDELMGRVRESLLIYGKTLPAVILAKFDDIFLSVAERTTHGLKYMWGTSRSGPLSVYIPKGMEKDAPPAQQWPYEGVPVGSRTFSNLPPRVEQDFTKLYGDRLFGSPS